MGNNDLQGLKAMDLVMGYPCNVRCIFCYQADFSNKRVLDQKIWGEKLLPAYEVVQTINMQGGEPTVLKGCRQMLELLAERYPGVKLSTVTNGVRFEGIFQDIFLRQGIFVNFSLNAIDKPVYDEVMLRSDHQRVFTNLDTLVRRRDEEKSTLEICGSLVVIQPNLNQMAAFIRHCRDREINAQITIDWILSAEVDLKMAQEGIAEAYEAAEGAREGQVSGLAEFDWLLAMHNKVKPVRERWTEEDRKKDDVCHVPFERLFVDYDGICQVCCLSWYPVGDLKTQSIQEIWNGEKLNRFRERMKKGDYRDCAITCPYNPSPVTSKYAIARKVAFKVTRDPQLYVKKARTKWKMKSDFRKIRDEQASSVRG